MEHKVWCLSDGRLAGLRESDCIDLAFLFRPMVKESNEDTSQEYEIKCSLYPFDPTVLVAECSHRATRPSHYRRYGLNLVNAEPALLALPAEHSTLGKEVEIENVICS